MKKIIAVLSLTFCSPLFAGEHFCGMEEAHPIDVWFDSAIQKTGGVTVNIREVQGEAYNRWDKELNRVYGELMRKMDEGERGKLREAQRAWLKFRDAEFQLLWSDALYGGLGGTMAPVAVSDTGREIMRHRVCTLLGYQKMAEYP